MNALATDIVSPVNEPARTLSPFSGSEAGFALAQRQALALSRSSLVPKTYQGNENIGNVMIAMELANRIGASPLMVMQSLYIVQGKPSWSSSFLIATVNACGRFEPIRFEIVGDDPAKPDYKVRAYAKDKASGEICYGAWIAWPMVKAEGWDSKTGSKWKTMPGQMFLYRAAGFWTRVYAPEISLGIQSTEEVQDVFGHATIVDMPTNAPGSVETLKNALLGVEETPEVEPEENEKPIQYDQDTGEVLPDELQD